MGGQDDLRPWLAGLGHQSALGNSDRDAVDTYISPESRQATTRFHVTTGFAAQVSAGGATGFSVCVLFLLSCFCGRGMAGEAVGLLACRSIVRIPRWLGLNVNSPFHFLFFELS